MRKLNEVRRNDDEFITVDYIDKSNYKKYVGRKVNVTGDVYLTNLNLREIPITFGKVDGNFYCYHNRLTSLSGCPSEVGGDFYCFSNKLKSLEGSPDKIDGDFDCSSNELTSLNGCPSEVGGNFDCSNNKKQFTINNIKGFCKVGGDIFN